MHATDVVGYTFEADQFCPSCMRKKAAFENEANGDNAEFTPLDTLLARWAARHEIDMEDEESYDSGDFPKAIMYSTDLECERCRDCGEHLMGDDCITYHHQYRYGDGKFSSPICQNGRCGNVGQGDPCGDGDCLWHPDNPDNPFKCSDWVDNDECEHEEHQSAKAGV